MVHKKVGHFCEFSVLFLKLQCTVKKKKMFIRGKLFMVVDTNFSKMYLKLINILINSRSIL